MDWWSAFTADQIDTLDNTKIEKMYARYEARLGAAMTKIYAGTVAMFLPIENLPGLIADLESDPFVGHALSTATYELYHRYPKEAAAVSQTERREGLTNWTPWVVGACLAGGALVFLRSAQTRRPASAAPR